MRLSYDYWLLLATYLITIKGFELHRPCQTRRCQSTGLPSTPRDDLQFVISRRGFLTALVTAPIVVHVESAIAKSPSLSMKSSLRESKLLDSETFQESVSGALAGSALTIFKAAVKYPLDTATVRLQMPNSVYSILRPLELLEDSYRGIFVPLLANIPAGAVFFGAKDATKAILNQQQPALSRWLATCIAVGVAQIPYWAVRNPSEVVKTRQQSGVAGYGEGVSAWNAFQNIYNETNSVQSFYIGYWENIIYTFPADVIKFGLYEGITGGRKGLSPAEGAMAGAISTAVAQFLTTPLDVIRNRIMTKVDVPSKDKDSDIITRQPSSSSSYLDLLTGLWRDESWDGLFAGWLPRVGKALVSGAVQFATYEETKQKIQLLFRQRNGN